MFFFFEMEGTILTTSCCPFLEKEGIVHQSFYTNTPKQKWKNRNKKRKKKQQKSHLVGATWALLIQKKKTFQRHYGKEVVLNATHLINYPLVLWAAKLQLLFFFFLVFPMVSWFKSNSSKAIWLSLICTCSCQST